MPDIMRRRAKFQVAFSPPRGGPYLTPEEEARLGAAARRGDREARDAVVLNCLPLILAVARDLRRRVPVEDAFQHAVLKCLENARNFRPEMGCLPKTYLGEVARGQVELLAATDGVVRRPHPGNDRKTRPLREETRRRGEAAQRQRSLDSMLSLGSESPESLASATIDESSPDPVEGAILRESGERFERLLLLAPRRERDILRMRFSEGLTNAKIGARIGVSRERVRVLACRGLDAIRARLAAREGAAA